MNNIFIGYDIGTKTVKAVYGTTDSDFQSIKAEHFSNPQGIIEKISKKINPDSAEVIGYATGRYRNISKWHNSKIAAIDWTKPVVKYCKDHFSEDIRYIVDIGAAGLSLLELKDGKFHRFNTNSICASGTGSFLDQQMIRMGLSFDEVDKMHVSERVPSIASRCAVFAKSDLIHRQQEGYTIEELWNGLVKGMAEACFITLLRGDNITGKTLFIGGLVKNKLFLHYFSKLLDPDALIVPDEPDTFLALANYHFTLDNYRNSFKDDYEFSKKEYKSGNSNAFEAPLNPEKSAKIDYYSDPYGNEITIYERLNRLSEDNKTEDELIVPAVLGVDIGSTSTKAALIDNETGELLIGLYRKTHGNPLSAYQKILRGINRLTLENPYKFDIKGMGTTGSGRKIVGAFAGADKCINEITAHLKGALSEVPDVRTIFEIGGQDSKYIFVEDGWMKDANMNYVCAAGTGSFLEEQAQNLNFELNEFEDLCRGVPAPKTNDRCTVFMEQDSKKLLIDGHSRSEVVASLLYSVCRNYLHRVVQNRPIEEPILFLGATARNKGLVEAFSNILQKKINTSPNSHLTGAIGVAELCRTDMSGKETKFKGFSLHSEHITVRERNCTDCHNNCRIMYFETDSGTVSWGFQCGKEGLEKEEDLSLKQKDKKDYFRTVSKIIEPNGLSTAKKSDDDKGKQSNVKNRKENLDKPTIYIPKALFYYSHNYLWLSFWKRLGYNVEILPDSDREVISTALAYSPNEICFPLKMAIGHVVHALKAEKLPIFLPYLIRDIKNPEASNSYFCPMTQGLPPIIKSILQYNGLPEDDVFNPVIDLSNTDEGNIKSLQDYFRNRLKASGKEIAEAFSLALKDFTAMNKTLYDEGEKTIKEITKTTQPRTNQPRTKEKPVLVIIGRSYNLYDSSLNLGLLKDAKKYGYKLIPTDLIPVKRDEIGKEYRNMYWAYGQKVIAVALELNKHPNLFPIFLTNFNCGPDSFILSVIEDIWKDKPSLILELDEHSGNAGYLTRIEAFLDRIESHYQKNRNHVTCRGEFHSPAKKKDSLTGNAIDMAKIDKKNPFLIPPMTPIGTILTASAFRSSGYNAIPMVKEDTNTFHLGKTYLRGSECMPAASTLGSVIDYCMNSDNKIQESRKTVFMPSASGPCRFGQYGFLHKMIYDRNNINADVFSLTSADDYGGTSTSLRMQFFRAIMLSDILTKLGCKLRPYEKKTGSTDELIKRYINLFAEALEKKNSISKLLKSLRQSIDNIEYDFHPKKPLVGIVGEIYVRSSPFSNDNLIEKIEFRNAEAWLTPIMEWLHYTGHLKTIRTRTWTSKIKDSLVSSIIDFYETSYYDYFDGILTDRKEPETITMIEKAEPFISDAITGEAVLTIGRTICFIEQGASMIVNVAPFGCMPGTISSVILKNISHKFSTPIVSLYYDGYVGFDTQLEQYLNNLNPV